jgi:DnaJ-class molecular chaperone
VSTDSRFGRRGRHVTTTARVPLTQAILGTTVEVTTLDEPVTL